VDFSNNLPLPWWERGGVRGRSVALHGRNMKGHKALHYKILLRLKILLRTHNLPIRVRDLQKLRITAIRRPVHKPDNILTSTFISP